MTRNKLLQGFEWSETLDGPQLTVNCWGDPDSTPGDPADTLATLCYAAILTSLPSPQSPLTIRVKLHAEILDEKLAPFAADEGWKVLESGQANERLLSCRFAWDPHGRTLTLGSVPRGRLEFNSNRPWTVSFDPLDKVADGDPAAPQLP